MKITTPSRLLLAGGALALLAGCATQGGGPATPLTQAQCTGLTGQRIDASNVGIPSGAAIVDSAVMVEASALAINERSPTPAGKIVPALPQHCKVLGRIAGMDARAPFIHFQVNLPAQWNRRSVQYGGGGFNGVLITGTALVPAARFDQPVVGSPGTELEFAL